MSRFIPSIVYIKVLPCEMSHQGNKPVLMKVDQLIIKKEDRTFMAIKLLNEQCS